MSSRCLHSRHNEEVASASRPEEPLRGCSLSTLLCNRSLLRSSDDPIAAHSMSAPVCSLDIFLSHAWCDSGCWKQVALLLCCSPPIAYKTTVLLSLLGVCLTLYRFRQSFWYRNAVMILGLLTFVISTLLFSLHQHRNTTVFLDKCCIDQTNYAAKARGIWRLSDYLQKSDKIIILWTPNYLDRLWCVYELAVFMQTHDKEDVIVVNLGHVKLCVSLLVFHLLEMFIQWIRIFNIDRESGTFMFCSVLGDLTAYILVGRQAYRCFDEWTTFASKVKSFSLRRAKCTSREDHKKLTKLIRRMYGSEANFAAVVKRLCVGRGTEEHAPMWFLSPTSLRIMSASFVPSIAYGAASALLVMFTEWERPMANIASIGSAPEFPCASATFPWAIRTRLLPVLIRSFQVPLMLLFVHKLAGKKLQPRGHLLLGILYAFAFIILTSLSQFTCGLGLFHGPFYEDPQGGLWYEGSLLLAGLTELGFVWSVSKWLYSHQLPSIIS